MQWHWETFQITYWISWRNYTCGAKSSKSNRNCINNRSVDHEPWFTEGLTKRNAEKWRFRLDKDQYGLDCLAIIGVICLICSCSYHILVPSWKGEAHESMAIGISCDGESHFGRYYRLSQPKAITKTSKHSQMEHTSLILQGFDVTGETWGQ